MEIARGGSPRPIKEYLTTSADGVNWIKIGDTEKGGKYINSTKEKIKPSGVSKSRLVHRGDFLLTNSMSFGRPYILNIDGCIHDGWLVFSDIFNVFYKEFLYYVLSSPFAYLQFIGKVSGAVVKNLNSEKVAVSVFPLPPVAEQVRIVAEIEKFEPLIAEYDKLEQQATKLDSEIYDKLKKSILQYAIQGKLVPQDKNDEPASELLKRIRAEKKAQLGKKYVESYIFKGDDNCYYEHINGKNVDITEEIPFDLPNGWEWERLNNLCYEISDIDHNMPKSVEEGVLFLSAKDLLNDGTINYTNNVKYISEEDYQRLSTKSSPIVGDIIYSRIGACLGKARIVKQDTRFLVSYSCCTIKPVQINTEYLRYILDDVFVLNQAKKKTQSIGVPDLGIAEIKKFRIPIPPLAEQKRIVDKIDEIFAKL